LILATLGCSQQESMSGSDQEVGTPGTFLPLLAGANVLAVSVGNCGPSTYFNEPCVTVTICTPGTSQCQTIPNVLLDTGSYGLRLFSSAVTVPLNALSDNSGNTLAECAQFGSGSDWGPVKMADVQLGGEPVVRVPVQIIDSTFPTAPEDCTGMDISPQSAGFNGILGVGLFSQDCGDDCVNDADSGTYFSCSTSGYCTGTAVPLADQVINPIASLPVDNNGVILQLPGVVAGGVISVQGNLILGIGTQSNNTPSSTLSFFPADSVGNFSTQFNGQDLDSSFLDSGSNALYFPSPISTCQPGSGGTFYCPASTTAFSAIQGSGSSVNFQISNANSALSSGNAVFSDIGGNMGNSELDSSFDWGLPFFFGKSIYVGINGKSSSLGAGPSWAW
jgi:hypothetical protein